MPRPGIEPTSANSRDLLKDAVPTELHGRGIVEHIEEIFVGADPIHTKPKTMMGRSNINICKGQVMLKLCNVHLIEGSFNRLNLF